jgi:F0F1-type ATP synthase assembly protein I
MTFRGFVFKLLGVGWFVAICIVGGAFGGYLLDKELDTKPIFSFIFLTLGTVFAMYMVYRWLRPGITAPVKSPKKPKSRKEQR